MRSKGLLPKLLLVLLIIVLPLGSYFYLQMGEDQYNANRLPKYFPLSVDPETGDTTFHTVPPFHFISQLGDTVTNETFAGKIYVADFFFSHCQGICPKMTNSLTRVQKTFQLAEDTILMLSHTVDPKRDSVERLLEYAELFDANHKRWFFVTGPKPALYEQARKGFKISASDGDGGDQDFVHSEKLVLVDKIGRIRGYYDGTDSTDVNALIKDIIFLIAERDKAYVNSKK